MSENRELPDGWQYSGDINLEYGGNFFKLDESDQRYGYMDAVRVTDLESATGADGLVLIEAVTVLGFEDKTRVKQALECCGLTAEDLRGKGKETILLILADCLLSYGHYDPANRFPDWHTKVIVYSPSYNGNKHSWDGWEVDKEASVTLHKDYDDDLKAYIEGEWLN